MDYLDWQFLDEFIISSSKALDDFVFTLPDEAGTSITYLPFCRELAYIGNMDTPEYLDTLRECGLKEQNKHRSLCYYRIFRQGGKPLRADLYAFGKLKSIHLFRYNGDIRYCFLCTPEGEPDRNRVGAVGVEEGRFAWESVSSGTSLTYRQYAPDENGEIQTVCVGYVPSQEKPIRFHSKGVFRVNPKMRYKETFLWQYSNKGDPSQNKLLSNRISDIGLRLTICFAVGIVLCVPFLLLLLIISGYWKILQVGLCALAAAFACLVIFGKSWHKSLKAAGCLLAAYLLLFTLNTVWIEYDQSLIIDTNPNINLNEYLPFDSDSKIVTLGKDASLHLDTDLPVLDGAAAVFPVYSAFVNAVYPETTELFDGVFEYNNTVIGYQALARRETDIFFGAYPSKQQIEYAKEQGTEFEYTQIGWEAFVFFVNVDNPIDSLTAEQIRGIYSGEITNWKEVGGKDEPITAFQRNEGSGSQSMLIRFMGETPIMEPDIEEVNGFMGGIIEQVADYRNKPGSIGFSFRYYVEGIIQNPNIKMIRIDSIAPTVENISSGLYPITAPLYAVTYAGNDNPNVAVLLDWVLSEEGQELIEKTGYVGILESNS